MDPKQIALTAARVEKYPDAAREEILTLLCAKAREAARGLLAGGTQLVSFEKARAKHYKGASLHQAIERHTAHLAAYESGVTGLGKRIADLREMVEDDEARLSELKEARCLAAAAKSLARELRYAWGREKERILRQDELRSLKFSTAMKAAKLLLGTPGEAEDDDEVADVSGEPLAFGAANGAGELAGVA